MSSLLTPQAIPTAPPHSVEVIRCGVGDEIYCLEMSAVASVMPAGDLRLLEPDEPDSPVGVLTYRQQELSVFDLSALLNLPVESNPDSQYVVLIHHPVQNYGLRVDSVSRVIRLAEDHVLPLPKLLEHTGGWFRGIADFTRTRHVSMDEFSAKHLPGVSEPREAPSNRRRDSHQMQLVLNTKTLLAEQAVRADSALPIERLLTRYAAVDSMGKLSGVRQLVVFSAGVKADRQILIGLSISQVAAITEPLSLIAIPGAKSDILGLAQWRNCPVPVINFQASLDCEDAAPTANHWLIARDHQSQGLMALPVAGRIQSLRLPISHRPCPLPDADWKPFVLGSFEFEERILIIPRLEALCSAARSPLPAFA